MTESPLIAPQSTAPQPADPLSALGIGGVRVEDGVAFAEQQLSARFADHRGRIELPALAVLFDDLGGIPFHVAQDGAATLQARLTLSYQGDVDIDDRLSGVSRLRTSDEHYGGTTVEIRAAAGDICCVGTARNVRVGRASADDAPQPHRDAPPAAGALGIALPAPIEAGLEGAQIVDELVSGTRPLGPLAELLGGRLESAPDLPEGSVRFISSTRPWMGNTFGTMHGGIIATIVAQASSFAAQAGAPAGADYQLGDLTVGFYRSPAVQGEEVTVDVVPIKTGRRIASFEATLRSHDGVLLSRATADAHYR
ncbi:PaaI family thioesterase [Gordonia soli]|uniref:Acyl-CoA thioesterase-like N-terminal HotDog domain-containing protein n=1 Tax=Gordonia soli NBRC 108243 TaxID=1223545 RepID=M0QHM1_9ACTN|nr:PaaI family thioesterase [Gordonia soli]GAC67801.1 hypothetical protein GS4_11_00700 [Gordonia soli NBRC 108243]